MKPPREKISVDRRVHVLPVQLQNQISAGEVVERPASVVKELVENALDAGASNVRVELEGAGKRLIRVIDDGHGMEPGDARVAVQRFATSKLKREEDLHAIYTFGFRGEALAAIASVSRFSLETSPQDGTGGFRLEMEPGHAAAEVPAPPVGGTQIEVRDLFFNTPARLKFLKTDATELWHAVDAVTRLALASWRVGFSVRSHDRLLLDVPAADTARERLFDLFGADFVDSSVTVETLPEEPVRVTGFVPAAIHHATRKQQFLFVNGRSVRHPILAQAIYRATDRSRPGGRHPAFVLYVEVPPEALDVNVHPTKQEIRFSNPQPVHRAVDRALRPLRNRPPGAPVENPRAQWAPPAAMSPAVGSVYEGPDSTALAARETAFETPTRGSIPVPSLADTDELFSRTGAATSLAFGGTFFLYGEDGGITIVDHHAAHERILYESFLKKEMPSQRLLVPRQIELPSQDATLLAGHREILSDFGLEVETFGDRAVVVRQVPAGLPERELAGVLGDLAALLAEGKRPDADAIKKEMAARLACHDALRSGDTTSGPERTRLLERLDRCDEPATCPHGRPTRIHIPRSELFRRFKRQ